MGVITIEEHITSKKLMEEASKYQRPQQDGGKRSFFGRRCIN